MVGRIQSFLGNKDKRVVEVNSKDFTEIQAQWVTVRGRIRQKIGDAQFKSWIKVISLNFLTNLYDHHYHLSTGPYQNFDHRLQ